MRESELEEWKSRNTLLQQAFQAHRFASTSKEKEKALTQIKRLLEWPPFMNICYDHSSFIDGITRYGVDYETEKCIGLIDRIANGEIDHNPQ